MSEGHRGVGSENEQGNNEGSWNVLRAAIHGQHAHTGNGGGDEGKREEEERGRKGGERGMYIGWKQLGITRHTSRKQWNKHREQYREHL